MNRTWPIRRFVIVVLTIEASLLFLGLTRNATTAGAILWRALTLVCLLYLPGVTLLRALRLQAFSFAQHILYSVGLSVAFDMFAGFTLDILGPSLGVPDPISQTPILVVIGASVALTAIGCYIREQGYPETAFGAKPSRVSESSHAMPYIMLALLVLILGILGPTLLNTYGNNLGTRALFALVAAVPLLVAVRKPPSEAYPGLIFACALALLYHRSLVSYYITGWDIQYEYYFAHLTIDNHFANLAVSSNVGAMLSTTIFAPEIALATNMSLSDVFKWVYPLFYALMPVGLYLLFAEQLSPRFAFFSSFLVISSFIFYQVMLDLPRQQVAELFLVLFLLTITSEAIPSLRRSILVLFFCLSIIVSHYSISYVFAFGLIVSVFFLEILSRKWGSQPRRISTGLSALYLVAALGWYMYTSQSSVLNSLVMLFNHVISSLATELLSPSASQPVAILSSNFPPLHLVTELLYASVAGAILWGFFLALRKRGMSFKRPYLSFSFAGLVLLIPVVTLPYVAAALNFNRFYQIALLLTAPFALVPFSSSRRLRTIMKGKAAVAMAAFLATFLLFSSGLVYELAKEPPPSMSLDANVDYPRFVSPEVAAASWLAWHHGLSGSVYADGYRGLLLIGLLGSPPKSLERITTLAPGTNYVFLGNWNLENNEILVLRALPTGLNAVHLSINRTNLESLLLTMNLVYDSGAARIFESDVP